MKTPSETYIHHFSNGSVATATVSLEPPRFDVEWEGKPTRQILPEYFAWRTTILNDFAAKTGERVLVINLL